MRLRSGNRGRFPTPHPRRRGSPLRRVHLPCLALAGFALCAPPAAVAKPAADARAAAHPSVRMLSVSSPPSVAGPSDKFNLTGRVRNRMASRARVRLTVTLRRSKTTKLFRKVRAQRLAAVKGGRTLRFRTRIKLPADIAPGRYFLRACGRIPTTKGSRGGECRFAKGTLTVPGRSGGSQPGAGNPGQGGGGQPGSGNPGQGGGQPAGEQP